MVDLMVTCWALAIFFAGVAAMALGLAAIDSAADMIEEAFGDGT